MTTTPAFRVELLETLIVLSARDAAAAAVLPAYTARLLQEGIVSPGDLHSLHLRAHATAQALHALVEV